MWTLISGGKHRKFMPHYWVWPICYVVRCFPYNSMLLPPIHIWQCSYMYDDNSSSVRTFTQCQYRFYLMYFSHLFSDAGITIIPISQMRKLRPREVKYFTKTPKHARDLGTHICLTPKLTCLTLCCVVGKIPWRRIWQPTPVLLPGKSHGQKSLAGYSPWGCKRAGHDLVTKQQVTRIQVHRIPGVTGKRRSLSQCAKRDEKNWKE